MDDLRYRMIMALNAADIGQPVADQAALICAEIAEQYCAEQHDGPAIPDPGRLVEVVEQTVSEDEVPLAVVPVDDRNG